MRERRSGVIINISSAAGIIGRASRCLYSGSKHALEGQLKFYNIIAQNKRWNKPGNLANRSLSTGFTESLSDELAPFNILCLLVQPGAFRTEFVSNILFPAASGDSRVSAVYRDTPVDTIINFTNSLATGAGGDPEKAAQTILDVVNGTGLAQGKERYLRLPLGSDCKQVLEHKLQVLKDTLTDQDNLVLSTDRE